MMDFINDPACRLLALFAVVVEGFVLYQLYMLGKVGLRP